MKFQYIIVQLWNRSLILKEAKSNNDNNALVKLFFKTDEITINAKKKIQIVIIFFRNTGTITQKIRENGKTKCKKILAIRMPFITYIHFIQI